MQVRNRLEQVGRGARLEIGDAHVAVAGLEHAIFHALDSNDLTRDIENQRLRFAFANDGQFDIGIRFAAHDVDRFVQRHALNRLVVELDDQVAGLNAGA